MYDFGFKNIVCGKSCFIVSMFRYSTPFLVSLVILLFSGGWAKSADRIGHEESGDKKKHWVDSVFESLTPTERLGQLFMVAAFSNKDEKHVAEIDALIRDYNIGGLIFFQGGPLRQASLTNHYQAIAKVPLFIAMDAEWGLAMRLDSTICFPKQMTLGAIQDNKYIYKMGEEIARECRRLGMQINFAPVIDINSNPANPVIGVRSFGEDKENVALKGIAYMKGMQDHKVMANGKHFPGHGDAGSDSHLSLPVIAHPKSRIEEVELYPFRELIKEDLMSIMVAHLHVPAYDDSRDQATTLSRKVVTDLLKRDMNFQGLIFTDALNMKGVANYHKPGDVDLLALLAGNDVLLYSEDVPTAIKRIEKAIRKGDISQEEVDSRVKKILEAKFWAGLDTSQVIRTKNLLDDLNPDQARALRFDLYGKAITVVKNDQELLPVQVVDTTSFASVSIGLEKNNEFQQMLGLYTSFKHFAVPNKNADTTVFYDILDSLKGFETVVVGIHNTSLWNNRNYGISEHTRDFIYKLEQQNKHVILVVFGSPYSLRFFQTSKELICAYEDNDATRKLVPQLIFGGFGASGHLPVSTEGFPVGTGIETVPLHRLQYTYPENAGIDSRTLAKIDSIANAAINEHATPGMQVLIAKDGKVIYDKAFGYLSYERKQPVNLNTIYDLASITKVAGTLQAVMFLYDQGEIDVDKKASYYLPELKGSNKEDLVIRDIMTHQAGLIPFIPHWKKTLDTSGFSERYFRVVRSDSFPNQVCQGLYSCASIEDSLWKWTIESDLLKKRRKEKYSYVYSDLGFYIMKRVVEKIINQPIEEFMEQNFYQPLGLCTMTYRPLEKFEATCIAPTENDTYFRKLQVRGTVHDQGAALLGGVGGHAGLFGNANDLAILIQMNLQHGYYGGLRYFLPETVGTFATKQFDKNRRGLGWDKPEPEGNGPTSDFVSPNTFGHTGFTGTAVWADPDQKLVYVFLSNRVYPDCSNTKLIKNNVRTEIQDVIYKAILNYTYQQ